jgi:hypothetical protein
MSNEKIISLSMAAAMLLSTVGCEDLPGTRSQQGAVIGGAGGAVAGAVIGGERHRWLGALIGGALGATGGYLIGAETRPATAEEAAAATTADVNKDGFVTLDEVVAMHKAGLSDEELIKRLDATDQIFELTAEQRRYLLDRGVSRTVVDRLPELNREQRDNIRQTDVISEPAR